MDWACLFLATLPRSFCFLWVFLPREAGSWDAGAGTVDTFVSAVEPDACTFLLPGFVALPEVFGQATLSLLSVDFAGPDGDPLSENPPPCQ